MDVSSATCMKKDMYLNGSVCIGIFPTSPMDASVYSPCVTFCMVRVPLVTSSSLKRNAAKSRSSVFELISAVNEKPASRVAIVCMPPMCSM